MSDIANFPTVMAPTDLASALATSQVQETSGGGSSFLKCDFETGEWSLGQEADDVTGAEVLVNTGTFKHGWILWSGGRPQKLMVPFTQSLPQPMDSIGEDHPSEGRSVEGAMIDNGDMLSFDTNSYGGRKGMDVLLGAVKAQAATGSAFLYPKVSLTSESYANAKRGGKMTFNPVLEILAWCDQDGTEEGGKATQVEDKSEPELPLAEKEAPKRQRRKRA